MQLYNSPFTPFGRKVMVLIHEAGLQAEVEVINATGSPLDPGSMPLDRNPLGKIPALVLDNGTALYDSRVICRYLDARSGAGLYPPEPMLWETLVLEATADGILEAALAMVYELRMRPAEKQFPDWIEAQWAKATRALDAVESTRIQHLNGPLDMGQIALACALGYLDLRHGARDWRQGRPGLAAWQSTFSTRPSMRATEPPAA